MLGDWALLILKQILHDVYIDLICQNHRNSGSIVHMYIYEVMQDFDHQQYLSFVMSLLVLAMACYGGSWGDIGWTY